MTKPRKTVEFVISFPLPPGATAAGAKEYIQREVCCWLRGGVHTVGSLFELDRTTVKVRHAKKPSATRNDPE